MKKNRLFSLAAVGLFVTLTLPGCMANVGSKLEVPKDAATTCTTYCHDLGLSLDSVVIMASEVGCVCKARDGAPTASGGGAGGGMAAMIVARRAQEQQRQAARR